MTHWISSGGANYIGVRNVAAAAWYVEELGLRTMNIEMDNGGSCIALGFSKDEYAVTLGPPGGQRRKLLPFVLAKSREGQRVSEHGTHRRRQPEPGKRPSPSANLELNNFGLRS